MNNYRGDFLAAAAVTILGGTIWALFYADFPIDSKDVLLVVIGALIGINKDVYSFEFGASKGGERNARAMEEMSKDAAARLSPAPPSQIKADDVTVKAAGDVTVAKVT